MVQLLLTVHKRYELHTHQLKPERSTAPLLHLHTNLILRDLDGRVTVVDWKTGLPSATGETELQLAIYGLYAVEAHGLTPEQLSGLEVNLRSGEEHFYALDKERLEGARLYIENSADRMQALLYDPQENIALIRDFPKVDDVYLCEECRFRRACDRD